MSAATTAPTAGQPSCTSPVRWARGGGPRVTRVRASTRLKTTRPGARGEHPQNPGDPAATAAPHTRGTESNHRTWHWLGADDCAGQRVRTRESTRTRRGACAVRVHGARQCAVCGQRSAAGGGGAPGRRPAPPACAPWNRSSRPRAAAPTAHRSTLCARPRCARCSSPQRGAAGRATDRRRSLRAGAVARAERPPWQRAGMPGAQWRASVPTTATCMLRRAHDSADAPASASTQRTRHQQRDDNNALQLPRRTPAAGVHSAVAVAAAHGASARRRNTPAVTHARARSACARTPHPSHATTHACPLSRAVQTRARALAYSPARRQR